ncbi:hypothetical protein ACTVCO_02650 [Sanguibacter sp. A247]|uniref:hypothetical protein n=1 Tax=unclassified Sanguibacter TaxID=2645534 RepID=UPI003FD883B0
MALSACAGVLVLAGCGDERPEPSPSLVVPSSVAPSKASRDGGDGHAESGDEDEDKDDGAGEEVAGEGGPFEGLVRGRGPRGA